jgi:hypothetical protein
MKRKERISDSIGKNDIGNRMKENMVGVTEHSVL